MTTCLGKVTLVAFSKKLGKSFSNDLGSFYRNQHIRHNFSDTWRVVLFFFSFLFLNISDLYYKTMQILGWEEKGRLVLYCAVVKNNNAVAHYCKGTTYRGRSWELLTWHYVLLLQVWRNNWHSELHLLFMDHRMKKRVSFGIHDVQELFRVFMELLL